MRGQNNFILGLCLYHYFYNIEAVPKTEVLEQPLFLMVLFLLYFAKKLGGHFV
jgi:hypothetical protein